MKRLISIALLTICACSSQPSESDGFKILEERLSKSSSHPKLISLRKTDGQTAEMFGVRIYQMAFTATAENSVNSDALYEFFGSAPKYYCKGDRGDFTGSITFEKSESGWHPTGISGPGMMGDIPDVVGTPRSSPCPEETSKVDENAEAPKSLTFMGPCLMYKCGGDPIVFKKSVDLHDQPDPRSDIVDRSAVGSEYVPDNMAFIVEKPGIYEVVDVFSSASPQLTLTKGERIYVYYHLGEGCYAAWVKGTLYGDPSPGAAHGNECLRMDQHVREIQDYKGKAWLRIPLRDGKAGWLLSDTTVFRWNS